MAGETANIAEVANRVSKEIFKWFLWENVGLMDENFLCSKLEKHFPGSKKDGQHQHPVDTVFFYSDPYLNKKVYLNTDLKSYSIASISVSRVKKTLTSLAKAVDCARSGTRWKNKYILNDSKYEIRGLLFLYNWDNKYDKDLIEALGKEDLSKIPLSGETILHVFDPSRIIYLYSVISDMKELIIDGSVPQNDYSFYYPDLILHKACAKGRCPATIETLCSPYMIIEHGSAGENDNSGYVIYYSKPGKTYQEFVYLFDILSKYQILSSEKTIRLRITGLNVDPCIRSNYEKAINVYAAEWGFDDKRKSDLDRIEFHVSQKTHPNYNPGILAWRDDD